MSPLYEKHESTIDNSINVEGNNNHILKIVNADGKSFSYEPDIAWNEKPQAGGGSAALLGWQARLTHLIGREIETKSLLDWADEEHALSFKIIEAPGGTGKTRLAAEFAQTLSKKPEWSAGFLILEDFERAQRLQWQGHWLIVIDYPEHAPAKLEALFRIVQACSKQSGGAKLRLLLLCRSQDGIREKLQASRANGYLSSPLHLQELAEQDNFELLSQALQKLKPLNPIAVDKARFNDWLNQSPLHKTALFVVALALHLNDSSAAEPQVSQQFLPGAALLKALVEREKMRWKMAEQGLGITESTLADVIAIATLFNGLPAADVNTVLRQHYGWNDELNRKVLTALSEVWHADTSNDTVYPALAPDLLAAAFLWDWQSQTSKRGDVNDSAVIAQLTENREATVTSLLQRWHMQAYDQTVRLQLGNPSSMAALSFLLENIALNDIPFSARLKKGFETSTSWSALSSLAVICTKPPSLANPQNLMEQANLAIQLNNHSIDLNNSGDREGALQTALESVDIFRSLAKNNSVTFEPDFAKSVNNLANRLAETGDHEGALLAAQEAVDIHRNLASTNAAAFEPELAASVTNLAIYLSKTGDRVGALLAAQEAVDIFRRLTVPFAVAFEPALAASLNNLANRLSETGDRADALLAAQESVDIRRRLAKINAAAFEPVLAKSMNTLANRLSETGDRLDALSASLESVDIYWRLAKSNAAAFEPDLAMVVNNLANRLRDTGDRAGALLAAQQAVALFESSDKRHKGLFEVHIKRGQALIESLNKQI